MRRIAIWGVGDAAKYLLNELRKYPMSYEVVAFIDSFYVNPNYEDITMIKPEQLEMMKNIDDVIITVIGKTSLHQIVDILKKYDFSNIYILQRVATFTKMPLIDRNGYITTRIRQIRYNNKKPTLLYFEMPIIGHCNLNCKGCFETCNDNETEDILNVEVIQKDMNRMKELFYDIPWIRLYGGEPLLHSQLDEICVKTRQIFADSEIDIFTNGLLIPKLNKKVLISIQKNDITVNITKYPPTERILDQILTTLDLYNIQYIIHDRPTFMKFYTTNPNHDADKNAKSCFLSGCRYLKNGRLSKCSTFVAFEKMNKQFGTEFKICKDKDWLDIYSDSFNASQAVESMNKAISLCRYCSFDREIYEWDSAKTPVLEDYILHENNGQK